MYKNILLTVDLTDESSWNKALPTAAEYCRAFGATLNVVTVVPNYGMTVVAQYFPEGYEKGAVREAEEGLRRLTDKAVPPEIEVRHLVAYGTIYEEILRVAQEIDCDLIIMAAHRPGLEDYLLGPNAARIVRHADCSVLVVRD